MIEALLAGVEQEVQRVSALHAGGQLRAKFSWRRVQDSSQLLASRNSDLGRKWRTLAAAVKAGKPVLELHSRSGPLVLTAAFAKRVRRAAQCVTQLIC